MPNENVIALDLEGTLISNAVSQFARPGLFKFLAWCEDHFEVVYIYSAVRDSKCHEIVYNLISQNLAPKWLENTQFVQWDRELKDLRNITGATLDTCLIVDDNRDYIREDQRHQWIEIKKWSPPYLDTDRELERTQGLIEARLNFTI
ncbi:MAG: NIF family HAD-type phosphatase [Pirellulales bacterium]